MPKQPLLISIISGNITSLNELEFPNHLTHLKANDNPASQSVVALCFHQTLSGDTEDDEWVPGGLLTLY